MKPDYVFVSGVSRTGTTLTVKVLNRSPEVAICTENYFLGHQLPWEGIRHIIKRNIGEISTKADVEKLVDFLYHGKFKRNKHAYWRWLRKKTTPDMFLEKMLAAPDYSERSIMAVMMEVYGDWLQEKKKVPHQKPILGEKTPAHLYYVPTLLEWYPNSKMIHTFRDPRAIYASELRRRKNHPVSFPYKQLVKTGPIFNGYILLQVAYTWFRAVRLHFKYEQLYPDRYYLSKFEDLVTSPEESIHRICEFLEISFDGKMLDTRVVSKGFKHKKSGFDQRAADRWQDITPGWVTTWFSLLGKKQLQAMGYSV